MTNEQYKAARELVREARRAGLRLYHIDGNVRNNSPDNLRVVDIRENRSR